MPKHKANIVDHLAALLYTSMSWTRYVTCTAILHHGPCRPKGPFAMGSENGNRRIFSEKHNYAHSKAMEIEQHWLCFSPTMKKPYCQSCWLFGDPSTMQKEWANGVSGNSKNIKSHEKTQAHSVNGRRGNSCLDRVHEQTVTTEATFCLYMLWIKNIVDNRHNESGVGESRSRGQWRLPRCQLPRTRSKTETPNEILSMGPECDTTQRVTYCLCLACTMTPSLRIDDRSIVFSSF